MNTCTVYWSPIDQSYLTPQPVHAVKDLQQRISQMSGERPGMSREIVKCPVAMRHLANTYAVKSPLKYDIAVTEDNRFITNHYDQTFFDRNVILRDTGSKLLSFNFASYVFFTEESSLMMEMRNASYSPGKFATNVSVLEGSIDIGKYFRKTDLAFFMNSQSVSVEQNETLFYVKFHTNKKIKLKRFLWNDEFTKLAKAVVDARDFIHTANLSVYKRMEVYYNAFVRSRYKPYIINRIKQNLME